MDIKEIIEIAGGLSVVGSLALFFINQFKELRRTREEVTDEAQRQYYDFLKLCIRYPDLGLALSDAEPANPSPEQRARLNAAYEFLVAVFEVAYLKHEEIIFPREKRKYWEGWENYVKSYCKRPGFQRACGWDGESGRWRSEGAHRYLVAEFTAYMAECFRESSGALAVSPART